MGFINWIKRHTQLFLGIVSFVLIIALGTQLVANAVIQGRNNRWLTTESSPSVPRDWGGPGNLDIPPINPNIKPGSGADLSGWTAPNARPPQVLSDGSYLNGNNKFRFASAQSLSYYPLNATDMSVEASANGEILQSYSLGVGASKLNIELRSDVYDNYFDDNIVINGVSEFISAYDGGDMQLDYAYTDEFDFEYIYDNQGRIIMLFFYDFIFEVVEYEKNNQPKTVKLNDKLYIEYSYNSAGSVIVEKNHVLNQRTDYNYSGNRLLGKTIRKLDTNDLIDEFSFDATPTPIQNGYTFGGNTYRFASSKLEQITGDGLDLTLFYGDTSAYANRVVEKVTNGNFTRYYYIGDRLVREKSNGYTIDYIINGAGNAIGLWYDNAAYYFVFDINSNVHAIIDELGNTVVTYEYNSLGEVLSIGGLKAGTIGNKNAYLIAGDYIYDHIAKLYYTEGGVYDPSVARGFLANGVVAENGNIRESASFERKPLHIQLMLEDKVKEVLFHSLEKKDILATVNAPTRDRFNRINGAIDIFTLPLDLTNFNFANLVSGNQVYSVVPNSTSNVIRARERINGLMLNSETGSANGVVSFFNDYSPTKGTIAFSGQFVYLNKYITYESYEDGIVVYDVFENNPALYRGKNVYSFDINGYELFSESIFKVDIFKGIKIAPGFNNEDYIIAENEFYCTLELIGRMASQIIPYADPNAQTEFNINSMRDDWTNMGSLPANKQLVLGAEGGISFADIEFKYPSNVNWARLGQVALMAVALVGGMALGVGAIVIAGKVFIAAMATCSTIGMVAGLAFATVALVSGLAVCAFTIADCIEFFTGENFLLDLVFNGDRAAYNTWKIVATVVATVVIIVGPSVINSLNSIPKCFVAGTLIATATGLVVIESIKIGDLVWSYNHDTGQRELREVVTLFRNTTDGLVTVAAGNSEIVGTLGHPFWVENRGVYVSASDLKLGDILLSANGTQILVQHIRVDMVEQVTVFNFEVEGNHNYFVGEREVLAHNKCPVPTKALDKQFAEGIYEKAPYHNKGNSLKSAAPKDGQAALQNSVQIKGTSPRRIGIADNEIVIFDRTMGNVYHGHVRTYAELDQGMKNALRIFFGITG